MCTNMDIFFITLFLCIAAQTYGGPVLQDSGSQVWRHAEALIKNPGELKRLQRWRKSYGDYDEFGSFGAVLVFGKSVSKDVEITCTACKAAGETLRFFLSEGYSEDELLQFIHGLCTDLHIMSAPICDSFTKNLGPEIIVVVNSTSLAPLQICSFLVGQSCGEVDLPSDNWQVTFPPVSKPPVIPPIFPSPEDAVLKVLHIADTHIDIHYAEGSPAECSDPLCCRIQSQALAPGARLAGKWGDYKCDTPMVTFDNFLQQASATHKDLDYIIWTGDLPSHDIWDQTRDSMIDAIRIQAAMIKDAFPDIPVYPAIGNHDSAPVNSFPQPEVGGAWNISWLYDELLQQWGPDYLINNETTSTIRRGAFYSTLARPGLRIISLNMNYCYLSNWWLIVNSTDPAQELDWLTEELQKSEYAGEKVHIIGHIPPGHSDCLKTWSIGFAKIITRYESTVVAQFYGHTHKDEFEVYYDLEDDTRPTTVSYIGPSINTYTDVNPGYRVYYVDGDRLDSTRLVVDHETWIFDLNEANKVGEPQWKKSYSFLEEYDLESTLPSDLDALYKKIATDDSVFKTYYKHYSKESPVMTDCNEDCKENKLCAIRSCALYSKIDF